MFLRKNLFFWASIAARFLVSFLQKKHVFCAPSGVPLGGLFFSFFFCDFLIFQIFSFFEFIVFIHFVICLFFELFFVFD